MRWPVGLAVAVPVLLGVAALGTGASRRFFDYDEIYHAHAAWQIAHGLRPFHDFQASHTPFLWYPLAAAWRILPEAPSTLVPLRFIAASGTLLSLITMTASFASVRREVPAAWWILGACLVGFDREILDYGLEFRPDSWSTAILFGAFLLLLTGRPAGMAWRYALFAGLATLASLASLKLVLLPVIFAALDLAVRAYRRDGLQPACLGYVVGVGGAALVAFVFLTIVQVDLRLTFDMALRYQWVVVSQSGYGRGLFESVIAHPGLLTLVVAGMLAWVAHLVHTQRRLTTYEGALLIFLLVQLVVVDRPYKQYYAPWFLIGAGFVPFLGFLIVRTVPRAAPWAFAAAVLVSSWTSWDALHGFSSRNQAREMLEYYQTLLRLSPGDDALVAYPPLHPVVRRDVFYGWSRTTDPAGHGTEAVMAALDVPGYSERFDRAFYRRELEARPPALIVAPLDANWRYEPAQWAVLKEYLAAHREMYGFIDRGVLQPFWFRRGAIDGPTLERLTGRPR